MKKSISVLLAASLTLAALLGGCSGPAQETTQAQTTTAAAPAETTEAPAETTAPAEDTATSEDAIRVGSLNGPTSMGLVHLMNLSEKGETENSYDFTMAGKADELVGKIANGDLDIALVPANVASVLYNKTQGGVTVLDVNTLGVLYVVASDDTVSSMSDLKGRTIYMTGKGTTPEYVMNYLLEKNGLALTDVDLQFKSEAAEVASVLKEDPTAIGVLPQPFATAACVQNEALKMVLDLTEQWNMLNDDSGSMLVTGVTLVRTPFLEEHKDEVNAFIEDHKASASFATERPDETAELIAAQGIVEKAPIAKKALPYCNIVCLTGQEMKDALNGYLSVLAQQDIKSIGGAMPGDDFYYIP
ncbi:MAG: ABC transporter substrate-binding protein [Clostridiales bacterium]|nr:ABC transporter substrate-binding protein [Clostridiales bacterium]